MARTKGSHDIAATVRGAFLRAAKQSEEDGRPLSTIILEQLQEKPLECLATISKFVPKEMMLQAEVTHVYEDMDDAQLREYTRTLGRELGIDIRVGGVEAPQGGERSPALSTIPEAKRLS